MRFGSSVVAKVVNWSTLCSLAEEVSLMEELRKGVFRSWVWGLKHSEKGLRRVLRLRPLEVQVSEVEVVEASWS